MTNIPVGVIDRLLWRRDEDGEWRHRLWREFAGESEGHAWYERYKGDHDNTSLTVGAMWTTWGIGVEFDYGHESSWDPASRMWRPTKRFYLTLRLGPFYIVFTATRPRRGFHP